MECERPLYVSEDGFFSIQAPEYVDEICYSTIHLFPDYTLLSFADDGLYNEEVLPAHMLVQGSVD